MTIAERFDPQTVRDMALSELSRPPERVYLEEPAEGLDPYRERAREQLADSLPALDTRASRFEGQRPTTEAKRVAHQPSTT